MTKNKDAYLQKILDLIKEKRNLDFSQYREGILGRRIMARARMIKRENFEQYIAYMKLHPEEIDLLMDCMTINVTEFFRDSRVFNIIEKKVIPDLLYKKNETNSKNISVWSCGCSSGEEAYSVLILLSEILGGKLEKYNLKIYATDIDSESLAKAKEGVYESCQFKNLTLEKKALIEKYFYNMGNNRYWIREEWPKYMEFKYHDVISDAYLENIDLILCRNLFIYFDRELQNEVLNSFYKSLNKYGFLVLGIVESIMGPIKEKFVEYDRDARIYIKNSF